MANKDYETYRHSMTRSDLEFVEFKCSVSGCSWRSRGKQLFEALDEFTKHGERAHPRTPSSDKYIVYRYRVVR